MRLWGNRKGMIQPEVQVLDLDFVRATELDGPGIQDRKHEAGGPSLNYCRDPHIDQDQKPPHAPVFQRQRLLLLAKISSRVKYVYLNLVYCEMFGSQFY